MRRFSHRELAKKHAIGRAAAQLLDENGYLETSSRTSRTRPRSKGAIYSTSSTSGGRFDTRLIDMWIKNRSGVNCVPGKGTVALPLRTRR